MKKLNLNNSTRKFVIPSLIVILLVLLSGVFYAFSQTTKSSLLYTTHQMHALKLYLPRLKGFELVDDQNNDFAMVGNNMMVTVLIDEKTIFTENDVEVPNLFSYTATIVTNNNAAISSIEENNGYYSFELENEQNGTQFHYYAATFESKDDFFLITFTCLQEEADKLKEKISHYFEMVEVSSSTD